MIFKGPSPKHRIRTTANIPMEYVHTRRRLNTDYETYAKNITDVTMQEARDDIRKVFSLTMAL
jgi:hypothetical protein